MKIPMIDLLTVVSRGALMEMLAASNQNPSITFSVSSMIGASDKFRSSRFFWARTVGPNLERLLMRLAEMHDEGLEIDHIAMSYDMLDASALFRNDRVELTPDGMRKHLLDHYEKTTPAPIKAWHKILGIWVVPPLLTPEEVAHIESLAGEMYHALTAPEMPITAESRF